MTTDDLARIEAHLGIRLPAAYRAAVLAYPPAVTDDVRMALIPDPVAVVAYNRFLRDEFPDDWYPKHLAIGNSPVGDTYFLKPGAGKPTVWRWDHETHQATQESVDFSGWLEVILWGQV